ncbi:MAG: TIR domain-containing protein, partial [Coriobacteriales bacterium]|nr:TIR domain-containing protein [Coriobacteriales bacterium]
MLSDKQNKPSVFISYSSKDREIADYLKLTLENNNISCWMAPYSIPSGSDYAESIPKGIASCDFFLIVLSKNSMDSIWVPKELDNAITLGKQIIPFKIDSMDLTKRFAFCLTDIQMIEAYVVFDEAIGDLLNCIQNKLSTNIDPLININSDRPILRSFIKEVANTYVERKDIFLKIKENFKTNNLLSLYGIGGIGKSEVAKSYMYEVFFKNKKYSTAVWLDFQENLLMTFASLPFDNLDEDKVLSLISTNLESSAYNSTEEIAKFKFNLLKKTGPETLIIIDGAESLTPEEIHELSKLHCHTIVISRKAYKLLPLINVSYLPQDLAIQLFFNNYEDGDSTNESQLKDVQNLLKISGGHALTIKLVSRFAQITGIPLEELYKELNSGESYIYNEEIECDEEIYVSLDEQLDKIFDISSLTDIQSKILARLSIIPFSGIKKYEFKKLNDENLMNEVDSLIRQGWIMNESGLIYIHPLVSNCVHRKIINYQELCYPFVKNYFDALDLSGTKPILHFLYKKSTIKNMLVYIDCNTIEGIKLYINAGFFLGSLAYQNMMIVTEQRADVSLFSQVVNIEKSSYDEFKFAYSCFQSALKTYNELRIDNELLLADIYEGLGRTSFNMNKYEQSRINHNKSYEYRKKYLPLSDKKYIASARQRTIAAFYNNQYEIAKQEAEQNLKALLSCSETSEEIEDVIDLAKGYSYAAKVNHYLKLYDIALQYYKEAIALLENAKVEELGLLELKSAVNEIQNT